MKPLGLKHRPYDSRDFSFHKNLGAANLDSLPVSYVLPSTLKDQNGFNWCTAESGTSTKETYFGIPFDPQDFFNQEGIINGSVQNDGYDLKILFATGTKYGAKPSNGGDPSQYKDGGYFWITGPFDLYDSIRSALWVNQTEKRVPIAGMQWFDEFTHSQNGLIQDGAKVLDGLHAIKVGGWMQKALYAPILFNEPRLALQNSFGSQYGDQGWFYFTRAQVNKYVTEGVGMWADTVQGQSYETISALQNLLNGLKAFLTAFGRYLQNTPPPTVLPVPAPVQPVPPVVPPVSPPIPAPPAYLWDTPLNARHSVRVICDEEGLSVDLKNILCACVQVESGFTQFAKHENKNAQGVVTSTDWGICQINDYYQIGVGKPFPNHQYVLDNPEKDIRWMCKMFLAGKMNLWASYTSGLYKKYL